MYSNNLVNRVCRIASSILDKYIFYQKKNLTHQETGLSVISEEAASQRNIIANAETPKGGNQAEGKTNFSRHTEDMNTVADFMSARNPDDTYNETQDKKKNFARKAFKQQEYVYNALFFMYNAFQRSKFL